MRRHIIAPRSDWEKKVESVGFHFHSVDQKPYWDEAVCYSFSEGEIATLEKATLELNARCMDAVEHVIRNRMLGRLGIPQKFHALVERSWENDDPTLYGRFDLAFGGEGAFSAGGAPKMLEYNADTPTSLLEAAVVQWYWLQETQPGKDQFNSIHEKLIAAWKWFGQEVCEHWHFACVPDSVEDFMTVTYLRDTAEQAGLKTRQINVTDIGYDSRRKGFIGIENEEAVLACFKLYPWEWMVREEFGDLLLLPETRTKWLEPAWKMVLSNKGILAVLWEMFPGHPNLLEASFKELGGESVRKPMLSREGANVQLLHGREVVFESSGDYGGPYVWQRRAALSCTDGNFAVLGSWIIGDEAAGMGIREDVSPVTGNTSRFVPHFIE